MKAVWPRASLRVIAGLGAKATGTSNGIIRKSLSTSSWVCQQCQHRSQQSRTLSLRPDFTQSSRHDQRTRFPSRVSTVRYESTSSSPTTSQHDAAPPTGRSDLPSQSEGRRSHISKRFTYVMDNIQSRVFIAGQRINDLTGYSGIEALKKDIEEQGLPSFPSLPNHHRASIPNTIYRVRCPKYPQNPPHSKRSLHNIHLPPLCLAARSQRTPPAQTRLVSARPRALHSTLPLGPYQFTNRSRSREERRGGRKSGRGSSCEIER